MLRPRVDIGEGRYRVEIAATPEARAQGLSGRLRLAPNQGMIFHFPDDGKQCMWMKDMHFPLDIIWLNSVNWVVHIEENVTPETYPKQFCAPEANAHYVLELPAGQVAAKDIRVGKPAQLCNVTFRSCYYY